MSRVYLELSRETSTRIVYTEGMIAALCPEELAIAIVCFSLLPAKSRNLGEDITMFSLTQLDKILTVA